MPAPVNSLEVTDWLTMECLRMLKNELFIGAGFNTDFSSEYTREFAVGETVRVPYPWRPVGGEGMEFDPEAVDRRHYTITVDKVPHVHFEIGGVEEALRYTRGREKVQKEILKPAAQRMRQQIETYAAQWAAINIPNVTGTLGTDPTTLGFAGAARTRLIQMAGWTGAKKTAAISPSIMEAIANAATVTTPLFNPRDVIAKAFVDGYLGENGGWEMAESMSLAQITAGTRANPLTVNTTVVSGATSIVLNVTSGDTFYAGEKFGITGRYPTNPSIPGQRANSTPFQCSIGGTWGQVYTATGATITLPITDEITGPGSGYQNIDSLPASGDTVTMWPGTSNPNGKTGALSLLFNRDAVALCGVKLKNPEQGGTVKVASQARDPETGIAVAFVEAFDPRSRSWVNRFDALLGFGNFYVRNCGVVLAGA